MVFPAQRVDRKMTINGARAFHPRIKDRFDLTLECIRRHYLDEPSPLSDVLARYADFFGLFGDFAGYVDFFHLQDLVNEDDFHGQVPRCRSRTSPPRRCREPSMRTSRTANARSSSLSRATGGSPPTLPSIRRQRHDPCGRRSALKQCSRTPKPSDSGSSWRNCSRPAIVSVSIPARTWPASCSPRRPKNADALHGLARTGRHAHVGVSGRVRAILPRRSRPTTRDANSAQTGSVI